MEKRKLVWLLPLFIIIVLAIFLYQKEKLKNKNDFSIAKSSATTSTYYGLPTPKPISEDVLNVLIDPGEVSKHNSSEDCWLIISGKVYDVSDFLSLHPGSAALIIRNCGKDATSEFQTKGGRGEHSETARSLLNNYLIGSISKAWPTSTLVSSP